MTDTSLSPPRRATPHWGLVAGVLMLLLLSIPVTVLSHAGLKALKAWGGSTHWSTHFNVALGQLQTVSISSSSAADSYEITLHGKAEFNDDETALTSLNGRLLVEGERDGVKRRWLLETPTAPGTANAQAVRQTFSVNGHARSPDAEDQRWMTEMMRRVARSVVDPAERVGKLLSRGGVAAVLADAEQGDEEDFRRRALLQALLLQSPLDTTALQQVVAQSTHMSSDFDRSALLQAVLAARQLSTDEQLALLNAMDGIGAAFERRQVLDALSDQLAPTAGQTALAETWLRTVNGISTDFERRSVIEGLMQRDPPAAGHVELALAASRGLQTDFEHRQALSAVAEHLSPGTPAELSAYAESAAGIGADFEHREALMALLQSQGMLDRSSALAMLASAKGIHTSFERMTLMVELAKHMPRDPEVIERYRQLARELGDYERAQAEKALDPLVTPDKAAHRT